MPSDEKVRAAILSTALNALMFAESVLYGPDGRELGRGNGTFARSKIALGSVDTYA